MIAPQFQKRQLAFLGLGTLLPACFLWLTLLDSAPRQTIPAKLPAQASSSNTLQRYNGLHTDEFSQTVDAAMVYSPQQVSATIRAIKDGSLSLKIPDAIPAGTLKPSDHYMGKLVSSTILAFTIPSSTSPYKKATYRDLHQNQAVQIYGQLNDGVIAAALILVPPTVVSPTPLGSLTQFGKLPVSPLPPPKGFMP